MDEPAPRIGILTVSDRVSRGEYEDRGGPAVAAAVDALLTSAWQPIARAVPDETPAVAAALVELVDIAGCVLVLTTGGTGPTPRDVTPEATRAVCGRELPGLGEAMRAVSAGRVPTAMLSRQTAGIRGNSLIINLPGTPAGVAECLGAVLQAAVHCVALLGGPPMIPVAGARDPHA
jgi:molybdopterin adenylyltransferase